MISASTDFLSEATIKTLSPGLTPAMYPIPIPTFPRDGDGAPDVNFPISFPSMSVTILPGLGRGPFPT